LEHLIIEKFLDVALPDSIHPSDSRTPQLSLFDVIQDGERVQLQHFTNLIGSEDAVLHESYLEELNSIQSYTT